MGACYRETKLAVHVQVGVPLLCPVSLRYREGGHPASGLGPSCPSPPLKQDSAGAEHWEGKGRSQRLASSPGTLFRPDGELEALRDPPFGPAPACAVVGAKTLP